MQRTLLMALLLTAASLSGQVSSDAASPSANYYSGRSHLGPRHSRPRRRWLRVQQRVLKYDPSHAAQDSAPQELA